MQYRSICQRSRAFVLWECFFFLATYFGTVGGGDPLSTLDRWRSQYQHEAMSDNVVGTMLVRAEILISDKPQPTTLSRQDQDIARLEGCMIPVIVKTEEGVERTFLNRNAPLGPQLLDVLGVSGTSPASSYRYYHVRRLSSSHCEGLSCCIALCTICYVVRTTIMSLVIP